jgi:hypothetical protein
MTSLKEKFDLEELISILIGICLAGSILMVLFYTTFPRWIPPWDPETTVHIGNMTYLVLAILFTVATPALIVLLWFLKRKA